MEKEFVKELVHVAVGVGGGVIVTVEETSEENEGVEEAVEESVGGGVIVCVFVIDGSSDMDLVGEPDRPDFVKLIDRSSEGDSTPSLTLRDLLTTIESDRDMVIVEVVVIDRSDAVKLISDEGEEDFDEEIENLELVRLTVVVRDAVPVKPRSVALVQTVWL